MYPIADIRLYRLTIAGALDDEAVAQCCPPDICVRRADGLTTLDAVRADQSAVIGIVRQLHNLGCTVVRLEIMADAD